MSWAQCSTFWLSRQVSQLWPSELMRLQRRRCTEERKSNYGKFKSQNAMSITILSLKEPRNILSSMPQNWNGGEAETLYTSHRYPNSRDFKLRRYLTKAATWTCPDMIGCVYNSICHMKALYLSDCLRGYLWLLYSFPSILLVEGDKSMSTDTYRDVHKHIHRNWKKFLGNTYSESETMNQSSHRRGIWFLSTTTSNHVFFSCS